MGKGKVRDVIGTMECFTCKGLVEIRISSEGRGCAYYICDDEVTGLAGCNDRHQFSGAVTRKFKAEAARAGWIGPMPDDYTPPSSEEGNRYAINFEKRLEELRQRERDPGNGSEEPAAEPELEPDPQPAAEPEPIAEPEPASERAEPRPRRRGLFRSAG